MSSLLAPVDYTCVREIPELIAISGVLSHVGRPLRILDIGSPQMLALALAACCPDWKITYINPHIPELNALRERCLVMELSNLDIQLGDLRDGSLSTRLGQFDVVFACSVLEHIHPEHGGDEAAARNLGAFISAGGRFCASVPFSSQHFHEYDRERLRRKGQWRRPDVLSTVL